MPATTTDKVASLLRALQGIGEAALGALGLTSPEDLVDVLAAVESGARVAVMEYYGIPDDADPLMLPEDFYPTYETSDPTIPF